MSRENGELVRQVLELFRNRDSAAEGGKGSGVEVEFPPYWQVFSLREGRVARQVFFPDEAEALEAAGLTQ